MAANNGVNKTKQKIIAFLKRVRPVAGAAFVNNDIYLSFHNESGTLINKKIQIAVADLKNLKEEIKKIKKESERNFDSLIISLPASESYLSVFEFPLIASEEQIEEAMKLSAASLPMPESDIYVDWMPLLTKNKSKKEAVLVAAKRGIIDSYSKVFEENKLAIIAVETHALSLGRLLSNNNEITMVIVAGPLNYVFIIYEGQMPYSQFNLPRKISKDQNDFFDLAIKTARRLIHFVSADSSGQNKIGSIIVLGDNEFKSQLEKEFLGGKSDIRITDKLSSEVGNAVIGFLASLGAVQRGAIPRRKDNIISLMAVGTKLAYERQRLFSLIDFFQKFLIGFGGFLIILFSGVFLMIDSLSTDIDEMIQKEQNFPIEAVSAKEKAMLINEKIARISGIEAATPHWENTFKEIDGFTNIGIPINSIKGISADYRGEFSLSGITATREILVAFKNYLGNSSVFETSSFPLALFLADKDIDFTVKAHIKNPKFLYKQ